MPQKSLVKIENKETKTRYFTRKNKKNTTEKLKLKKYDKVLRKHVVFGEVKK